MGSNAAGLAPAWFQGGSNSSSLSSLSSLADLSSGSLRSGVRAFLAREAASRFGAILLWDEIEICR